MINSSQAQRVPSPAPASAQGCGCAEGRRAERSGFGLSRRTLLLAGAAGIGGLTTVLGDALNPAATQYAFAGPAYAGDTVVVLSLRGGFDGMSALAPIADPDYRRLRPSLGIPTSRAIKVDQMFGLHPALAPLQSLWQTKKLAAVHAVGQPNPTRSHFVAMEEMENAAPGSGLRTGWIDRMVGLNAATPFGATAVGSNSAPPAMRGPNPEMTMESIEALQLWGADDPAELTRWTKAIAAVNSSGPMVMKNAAGTALRTLGTAARLRQSAYKPAGGATYPDSDLGKSLTDVAHLIKARVGLRIATVDVGNWDMHVDLGQSDTGWMFRQLTDLAQALAAFAADLGSQLNNVTLVTLSEFGRRAGENGSGGFDHGHGNVCFVLGGGVNGGKVYGRWPGLSEHALDDGDLAGTTDYRTILAEILSKRGNLPIASVFPKFAARPLGLVKAR